MAKTTGKINGTLILVDLNGTTIGCSTNATLNITNERLETTCKDDNGAKTYEAGSQDWSLDCEGLVKFDDASNFSAVAAAAVAKTGIEWTFGTANADDPVFTGTGFIGDFSYGAGLNTPSTWSFTVAPTGPIELTNT
jgi:predicted secreted protein